MPTDDQVPSRVGRYRILSQLARGGMGAVYRAAEEDGREVVVKHLLPEAARRPHVLRLFEREYETLSTLAHPRIIEVYEYGYEGGRPYYSMELLRGTDLRDLAPLPYREACSILRDVASSLALLHARRLVHRDVTPRNIRRTENGRAKLIDFGAVTAFGAAGDVVGTAPCIAPEVLSGLALDARSDLYALGVVAYFALTGRYPYPARDLLQLHHAWTIQPPRPSELVPEIPSALDALVLGLLRHDPMARPSSAAELIDRLTAIGELEPENDPRVAESYLYTPPLVGRDGELAKARTHLRQMLEGSGGTVVVSGDPGSGRSRLLAAFGFAAQLSGALVARADCEASAQPFVVPRQFLEGLLRTAPELVRYLAPERTTYLKAAFPEAMAGLDDVTPIELPTDPTERRRVVQTALVETFLELARAQPLVLLADNLESADEASAAFVAALADEAKSTRLLIMTTLARGRDPVAVEACRSIRRAGRRMSLSPLSPEDVERLVAELFASAPHTARLSDWLHSITGGNAAECLELLRHLVSTGVVRYHDGVWLLPDVFDREVPPGLEQARLARFAALPKESREICEALSVWRGPATFATCAALAPKKGKEGLFRNLSELVKADVLQETSEGYRFTDERIRTRILETLPHEHRTLLHRRAADVLGREERNDPSTELEAGWHWLQAGERHRGAALLARAGIAFTRRGDILHRALPALEAALEVYDDAGRRFDTHRVEILTALMFASLFSDHRLSERYGDRFVALAVRLAELDLAMRLRRFVGRSLALAIALSVAAGKHFFRRSSLSFVEVMSLLVGGLGVLTSVASTRMDRALVARIFRVCDPFLGAGKRRALVAMYRIVERVHATTFDRFEDAIRVSTEEVKRLSAPGYYVDLIEEYRDQLRAGAFTTLAITYAQAGREEALRYADELDRFELSYFSLMGLYARFLYHAYRGETAALRELRPRIEFFAKRGGTTWQAEMFVPSLLVPAYLASDDTLGLRESAVRLERTAVDVPSFRPTARFAHVAYLAACGRLKEAVDAYPTVLELLAKGSPAEFLMAVGGYARALNRLGRHEEAVEVCERAEALEHRVWRESGLWASEVAIQWSLAKAALSDRESAKRRLDEALFEFEPTGQPLRLATLHHARATLALDDGDHRAFARHLGAMHRWTTITKNPVLVAQYEALAQRGRAGAPDEVHGDDDEASQSERVFRALASFESTDERVRNAIQFLMEQSGAVAGFYFSSDAPPIAWPEEVERPPEIVEQRIVRLLRSFQPDRGLDEERTETQIETSGAPEENTSEGHLVLPLHRREPSEQVLVGMIALRPGGMPLRAPSNAMLETIARVLSSESVTFTMTRCSTDAPKAAR